MKDNKTDLWSKTPSSTKYTLPEYCPICSVKGLGATLKMAYVYVGVFPYIHAGVNLKCSENSEHEFTFCFPFSDAMASGYTVFDSTETGKRYYTDKPCPFHGEKLKPIRLLGDLVYSDGTRKMQLACPICHYSVRVVFK